jgi:hypothetical protein
MMMFSQFENKILRFEHITVDSPTYKEDKLFIEKLLVGMSNCLEAFIDELDRYKSVKII